MISIKTTPKYNGITIQGDFDDLNNLYDALSNYIDFYIDGIKVHQGVILVGDYYYYAGSGGALYVNRTFVDIKRTNGLVGTGRYNFDAQGRMYNGTSIPKPQDPVTDEALRIKGTDRFATSLEVADALKEELGIDKFDAVILVNGRDFADALAGSYLAADKSAPILMVDNKKAEKMSTIVDYISMNMKSNGTVYILGGEAAVPEFAEEALNGYNVKRLKGKNRYGTNIAILNEVGVSSEEILVANAKNFADSLSASATGKPLLLVGSSLNADQKAFLAAHPNCTFTILGGTGAVSADVEEQLSAYGSVRRLSGTNRYATSVKIAETYFNNADSIVLAYARNFPDGLAGGPLAYAMGAPLILVDTDKNPAHDDFAVTYAADRNIKNGYVLGGSGLVKDDTVKDILGKVPTLK